MPFRSLVLLCVCVAMVSAQTKRSLNHSDDDGWKSIASQKLSDDGRYLIYGVFPQVGDGEVVVREIASGKEIREPAGQRPEPPAPEAGSAEGPPPQARGVSSAFSADGNWLIFSVFPSSADLDRAKKEKKKPAEMPKDGLVILNLRSGTKTRIENVKSFQLSKASTHIAYLKENDDLILHPLNSGADRTFPDAVDYRLANLLLYADKKGVYSVSFTAGETKTIATGEGKYSKLTADEKQIQFSFLKDKQLHLWKEGTAQSIVIADNASTNGALTFSLDGERLFFGMAPEEEKKSPPAENGAVYDLWHYQDDYIQPMQKVRARQERQRSYRAVYHIGEKKFVPLADTSLAQVTPSHDGLTATGTDNRAYRRIEEYDAKYNDLYFVDTRSGKRTLLEKKTSGSAVSSPDGRYALVFDGRDWISINTATTEHRNLTSITGRAFYREDDDRPARAPSYGSPTFTKDSAQVLIPDQFDIWQFTLDGSLARNLTDGEGRQKKTQLRIAQLSNDPHQPGLDPAQPILLRAENVDTHDSGFWRDSFDPSTQPETLVMAPMNYTVPIKAKNADVLVLTASRFDVFPDLQVTDSSMKTFQRVSNVNPQLKEIAWGTDEIIKYRNADGKELPALLYKPANFDPAKKYPMIVYLYEKLTDTVNNFIPPAPSHRINASYYTSNGYVVLMPDIVYTIGYPGASALKCVVPATQKVIDMGFVDPQRVGIQGHSWGGYQIAYMVTQTNIFKAAAPGALVANMISAYNGIRWGPGIPRQFQYEHTQSRIGGTIWQYPLRYIENSPIFMADRVQTPILMLHNDADDAVPWYQGIEFFLALRRLGKEAYFFNYNGEPHGVRKRPNQKDYTVRMQEFFDHELKGAPKPAWMERGRPFLEKEPVPAPAATVPSDDHDQ